ncbi:MAG TPA: arginine deiminase family protein [Trebonia sp.]|nr:arginine deiminase family protein [Trebonia sp.]
MDDREVRANGVKLIKHSTSGRHEDMSPGGSVSKFYGVDSEVGRLRTVLVHRPGAELRRVTPQQARGLQFAALPWAERAQEEHDSFTEALRRYGVTVFYVTELLQEALEYEAARRQAADAVLGDPRLGDELRGQLRAYLDGLPPEDLAQLLILGLARGEFTNGRGPVFGLLDAWDYVVDPLPNLVFTRDASVWIGDSVAVTSPRGRRAEAEIADIIVGHHPQFAGTKRLYEPGLERLCGGDVLLLAPGVLAIGTGGQTSPAGMERLARRAFDSGLAHTILAVLTEVPGVTQPGGACLDTLCTVVALDTVIMRPAVAYSLVARTIMLHGEGLRLSHPQPFLEAAAHAMGIDRLRVIETGPGPSARAPGRAGPRAAWRGAQWDDASNLLALGPGTVVSYERNALTNARLEAAGLEVITVPGGELAGRRGGPRAICCPLCRDPASMPETVAA